MDFAMFIRNPKFTRSDFRIKMSSIYHEPKNNDEFHQNLREVLELIDNHYQYSTGLELIMTQELVF